MRRGLTLIEVVVAITSSVIVLGATVALVASLERARRVSEAGLESSQALERLAREFRRDVRAAAQMQPAEEQAGRHRRLTLSLAGNRTVEYEFDDDRVLVTERIGGESRRRDAFRVRPHAAAGVDVGSAGSRTVLKLVVLRRSGRGGEGLSREFTIEAVLGKDRRFGNERSSW